jgi:hypothetical protein
MSTFVGMNQYPSLSLFLLVGVDTQFTVILPRFVVTGEKLSATRYIMTWSGWMPEWSRMAISAASTQ